MSVECLAPTLLLSLCCRCVHGCSASAHKQAHTGLGRAVTCTIVGLFGFQEREVVEFAPHTNQSMRKDAEFTLLSSMVGPVRTLVRVCQRGLVQMPNGSSCISGC